MTTMTHEGYVATIELDEEAGIFHGRVINARAILTFEGQTIKELKKEFAETINDYREWCEKRGKTPEKPYSGNLSLRLPPDLHRNLAEQAAKANESINQFIVECLREAAQV